MAERTPFQDPAPVINSGAAIDAVSPLLADGAVTDVKIKSLTADKITAGDITATLSISSGGVIRANKSPANNYIILDGDGLRSYSGGSAPYTGGTETIRISTATGAAYFSGYITASDITGGVIRTALTGARVELGSINPQRIDYYSGQTFEVAAGGVTTSLVTAGAVQWAGLQSFGPTAFLFDDLGYVSAYSGASDASTQGYVEVGGGSVFLYPQGPTATLGFFMGGPPPGGATQQTVTGVRTGTLAELQTVVQNLLAALANYGLIIDSTT